MKVRMDAEKFSGGEIFIPPYPPPPCPNQDAQKSPHKAGRGRAGQGGASFAGITRA